MYTFLFLVVEILARLRCDVQSPEIVLQVLVEAKPARVAGPQVVCEVQLDLQGDHDDLIWIIRILQCAKLVHSYSSLIHHLFGILLAVIVHPEV